MAKLAKLDKLDKVGTVTCLRNSNQFDSEINNFILGVYVEKRGQQVIFVPHTKCLFCNEIVTSHQHWCKGCLGIYCAFTPDKNQQCPKHSYTYNKFSTIVCEKCGLVACNFCVNIASEKLTNCKTARSQFHQVSPSQFVCRKCL